MQPTMAEKSLGKVSAGLYLRDISEVREGVHADNFIRLTASAETSINKDCCLALVGSEATYCLELFNEVYIYILVLHSVLFICFKMDLTTNNMILLYYSVYFIVTMTN